MKRKRIRICSDPALHQVLCLCELTVFWFRSKESQNREHNKQRDNRLSCDSQRLNLKVPRVHSFDPDVIIITYNLILRVYKCLHPTSRIIERLCDPAGGLIREDETLVQTAERCQITDVLI